MERNTVRFCLVLLWMVRLGSAVYAVQPPTTPSAKDTTIINDWYKHAYESLDDNLKKSEDLINKAWKTSIDIAYDQGIADGYYYTGCVFERKGTLNIAKRYFERAVSLYVQGKFLNNLPDTYRRLGVIDMNEDRHYSAFEYFLNGLRVAEENGYLLNQVELSIELASYHNKISKDYKEAVATLKDAERLARENGYVTTLGPLYLQYGIAYGKLRDYEVGLRYCNLAKRQFNTASDPAVKWQLKTLLVEGEICSKTHDVVRLAAILEQIGSMAELVDDSQLETTYHLLQATQLYFQRDYENVLKICAELDSRLADKKPPEDDWHRLRLLQLKAFYALGDVNRADILLDDYEYSKDSLYAAQYIGQGREMNENYKLEKFGRQIKEQQLRLANTNYQRYGLTVGIVVLLTVLTILCLHFREKDRLVHRVALKNAEISVQNDILKQANKQNELLLREIHHRVKNSLQIINSLLSLQSRKTSNQEVVAMMQESSSRINSIALIHTKLYQQQSLSRLNIQDYVEQLGMHLLSVYNVAKKNVCFHVDAKDVYLDIDTAIPLGLILTELMTNSLKYAFVDRSDGEIYVQVKHAGAKEYELIFKDNGVGIPESKLKQTHETLGFRLIHSLTRQLAGIIQYTFGEFSMYNIRFKGQA
ncbi:sensor histidine kinase [Parapedobacter indicus]|uniref:histidine kinase n=1 Tax=Parapedobacter indicus TaxID=1477437 RepID=A0A1I3RRP6_9SPHI|nr:sensor histidine kinase [Parapedobacter indicus]PPL00004.1 two-component sensor histidine kinase [Parapedobacter indicus]SFJ49244.1 Two-component sensor histidine kinase, contains HisKA and HATPase domains [Parapedobacter indicus]